MAELEKDARELSAQVEQLTQALAEAERDKSRAQLEHSEHTQRLREQLNTVSPTMSASREQKGSWVQRKPLTRRHLSYGAAGLSQTN